MFRPTYAPPRTYLDKVLTICAGNIVQYLPLDEASGIAYDTGGKWRNGAYGGAQTFGVTGIGDGKTAISLPGTGATNFINTYSAALAAAFNNQELTASIWYQVSGSGVWTDAAFRQIVQLKADSNNQVSILKSNTNGQITAQYRAGATSNTVNIASQSATTWQHLVMTVSKAANKTSVFLNGVAIAPTTASGTWAGALASTTTTIGCTTLSGGSPWSGSLAHCLVLDRALSRAEAEALYPLTPNDWSVICDGDSLTAGNGVTPGTNDYPTQLLGLLGGLSAGWHVVNDGLSGDTLANMVTNASANIDPNYYRAAMKNVSVIWGGTNDIAGATRTGLTSVADLQTYCAARRAVGWRVLACELIPRNAAGFDTEMNDYNTSLRANWQTYADGIVKLRDSAVFSSSTAYNDTTYYNADKLHLTALGYGEVARLVAEQVRAL